MTFVVVTLIAEVLYLTVINRIPMQTVFLYENVLLIALMRKKIAAFCICLGVYLLTILCYSILIKFSLCYFVL